MRDDAHELGLHPFALAQLLVLRLELALAVLERTRHRVEGLGQLVQLGRSLLGQARREIAGGDATRAGGDETHRTHDAVREEDGECEQERGREEERGDADADGPGRLALRRRRAG